MSEENKKFIAPNSNQIKDYVYSYKDELKDGYYSYKCKYRKSCWIILKILKKELIKYIEINNIKINYEITKSIKEHKCKVNNQIDEFEKKVIEH